MQTGAAETENVELSPSEPDGVDAEGVDDGDQDRHDDEALGETMFQGFALKRL